MYIYSVSGFETYLVANAQPVRNLTRIIIYSWNFTLCFADLLTSMADFYHVKCYIAFISNALDHSSALFYSKRNPMINLCARP